MSNDAAPQGPDLSLSAGFERVDDQSDPSFLVNTMDQTSRWPSIIALRAFEAAHLALRPGDSLLDLGCGRGEVACGLAAQVAPGGRVLGIDASDAMLDDARARAAAAGVDVTFRRGDGLALGEPDASFDAARAERVLQWIPDTEAAVAELVRVLRPGGRLSLIDTDWRTLAIDIPALDAARALVRGLVDDRGAAAAAGGRLVNLCRDAGLTDVAVEPATHVWTEWDPDTEPAPSGYFPLESVLPQLADTGHIDRAQADLVLEQMYATARAGRFFMSLTMFAVAARKPDEAS
jgi:SAM-dependent methyltransferase